MQRLKRSKSKTALTCFLLLDYGYATFNQRDVMATIIDARAHFGLVMRISKWIEEVEWRVADLRNTFTDLSHATKGEHKGYVETLNLSANRIPHEVVLGFQLLEFRDNLWLHTTSIFVSMMVLQDLYPGVGIVNPSYHAFAMPDQKRRTAAGLGAANAANKQVIGNFNMSGHWVAFLVDRRLDAVKKKATCYMFDPLQREANYTVIRKSVSTAIEVILHLKGAVEYKKIVCCTQLDGSSCGAWCIAILELLLSKKSWDDCTYKLQPYLCLCFLHEAIAFVKKEAACSQLCSK